MEAYKASRIVLLRGFAYLALVTGGCSRVRLRRYLVAGVALALCCKAHVARAEEPKRPRQAEPFRLVWSSSADCGNAANFLAELQERTTRLRQADKGEHAITLIVETFRVAGGVRGELTMRRPDGDVTTREVPGLDCREVESAIALIAALMVDPLAGAPERAVVHGPPTAVAPTSESDRSMPASPAWSWRAEQRLTARTAVAPRLTWGQAWGLMLTREASWAHPSVALFGHLAHATTSKPAGSAELEFAAAELVLCPVGLRPDASWDLRACGAFQLGRLRGIGFQTADPATKAIVWSSASLELQGRYQLLGPLWLGWQGAVSAPFSRENFYLDPSQVLHRVPAWGLSFGVGLGLRFF